MKYYAAGKYMFKVNNRNTIARCEICSRLKIRKPERRHCRRSGVFIVNFGHIARLALVFLLLTLSSKCRLGALIKCYTHFWNFGYPNILKPQYLGFSEPEYFFKPNNYSWIFQQPRNTNDTQKAISLLVIVKIRWNLRRLHFIIKNTHFL